MTKQNKPDRENLLKMIDTELKKESIRNEKQKNEKQKNEKQKINILISEVKYPPITYPC